MARYSNSYKPKRNGWFRPSGSLGWVGNSMNKYNHRRASRGRKTDSLLSSILQDGFHGSIRKYKAKYELARHNSKVASFRKRQQRSQFFSNLKTFFSR